MEHDEPFTITREIELDIEAGRLWHSLSDASELASWLGDEVALDVREGGEGTVLDDGVLRHVRVDRVRSGHELWFTWWEEGQRDAASIVQFEIAALPEGRSRLTIVETLDPDAVQPMTAQASARAADRWGVRVLCLWACTVAAAALVR